MTSRTGSSTADGGWGDEILFGSGGGFIRLPVWGHIPLSGALKKILSHPNFLRLKGIRQLSFAHYVFPGATHTRFEHSLGVYHLMRLILQRLTTNSLAASLQPASFSFDEDACRLLLASCLLHDIGHYPHAHLIEDLELSSTGEVVFDYHQDLTEHFVKENVSGFGSLAAILEREWKTDAGEVIDMVQGRVQKTFSKIISGTLDPDKMDYLMRDAHHCNIPYGNIDIERLIESFVPDAKRKRFAITPKGIAPLESLMFAKYMMMRNVYWHHTVRTLSAMLRRLLQDAVDDRALTPAELKTLFYTSSDDRVLYDLRARLPAAFAACPLANALIDRVPYKRAITLSFYHDADRIDADEKGFRVSQHGREATRLFELGSNAKLRKEKEQALCAFLSKKLNRKFAGYEIILDAPPRKTIFDYDDFCELQLYDAGASGKSRFRSFDDYGESVFKSRFILEVEKVAKKFRITARADLAPLLKKHAAAAMEIIYS